MRFFLSFIIAFTFLLFFVTKVSAGGFTLERIGALDLQGTTYPHYWYTGTNVVLAGTAPASAAVNLNIDDTSYPLTPDASGNWTHSSTLTEGDHTITLSADSVTPYTFTLTIGASTDGVGAIPEPETPSAGTGFPTIIMLGIGFAFLSTSAYLFRYKVNTIQ